VPDRRDINKAVRRRKVVVQHPPIRLSLGGDPSIQPVGKCLACGHTMPLAAWSGRALADVTEGVCGPCRDAALPLRGPCSKERGCLCERV
jgi:hypothetical protein